MALDEMRTLLQLIIFFLPVGGAAHFERPNLPVAPGYHSSNIVVRLTPFTAGALARRRRKALKN